MWLLWGAVVALAGRADPTCEAEPVRLGGVVVASRMEVRSGLPFNVARIRVVHAFQGSFATGELVEVWTAGGTLPNGVLIISSSTSGSGHPLAVDERVIVGARRCADGRLMRGGSPFDLLREAPEGVLTASGKQVASWPPGANLEAAPSVASESLTEPTFDDLVAFLTADPAVLECREPVGDRSR